MNRTQPTITTRPYRRRPPGALQKAVLEPSVRWKAREKKAEVLHNPNLNMTGSVEERVERDHIWPSNHRSLKDYLL
jgi:hypothetical protein